VAFDVARAVHWLRRAAAQGNPNAATDLALLAQVGADTVRAEPHRAPALYRHAVALGSSEAMCHFGRALLRGKLGAAPQPLEGVVWIARSAEAGCTDAMTLYAECLMDGDGGEIDRAAARHWCERAFSLERQGDAALCAAHLCHTAVPADPKGERDWLKVAACGSDPSAAASHAIGADIENSGDAAAARIWYERALQIDPTFGEARDALAELGPLPTATAF
jgi:TPR repeat protein